MKRKNSHAINSDINLDLYKRLEKVCAKHRYKKVQIVESALEKEVTRLEKAKPVI